MINDMASLKQAMEQMDADDAVVADAAKDRAGQILSDAKMSFSKMADLIEQRRLLLRPKILSSIKRMDQPHGLGDAAFRDTSASLRREGQSFRQIAEALEVSGGTPRQYDNALQSRDEPYRMETEGEPDGPVWPGAPMLVAYILGYPFRHPIRALTIALLVVLLFNGLADLTGFGRRMAGYVGDISAVRESTDAAMSSAGSFFEKWMPSFRQAATPPASPVPSPAPSQVSPSPPAAPSSGPAATGVPPATAPGPSTKAPASAPTVPSSPAERTPRKDATGAPSSSSAAKGGLQPPPPRASEEMAPSEFRRKSRVAGPCSGGVGGCYWGGGQY
jgi:hypothetical protein